MESTPHSHSHEHEHFSLPLFILTVAVTLSGLGAALWLLAPDTYAAQLAAPVWKGICAFAIISLFNCFLEYFFHRYVLHTPAVPFLRRLYRQHTLHHALTRITRKRGRAGQSILFIENKFPIVEPEQGEASFFPWYSLAVFAAVITPVLALLQWVLPSFPWFMSGYLALASSLALYEILHAINHWPFETWEPLIQHPRWGRFWRPAYGFHLRHHAVIDCNESISGFFGLPVADWVFRTCIIPQTVFADGEVATPEKFASPRPRALIRYLDRWAIRSVQRRREKDARSQAAVPEPATELQGTGGRVFTRGERIANWVTHGVGLASSITALTLLIVFSSLHGDAWHVVSFTVFGLTLLLLHAASTVYQAQRDPGAKPRWEKLGHAAAFLLIAGTYTPFLLTSLRGPWGWTLFGFVWGLSGAGAVFTLVLGERLRTALMLASLFLAWALVIALKAMMHSIPATGLILLLVGAVCYAVGVWLSSCKRLRYHYAMWQMLVLGGSACHLIAALVFLLPERA